MYAHCVEELRLSEEAACKRIRAARAARQFPVLFGMLADGRLHLTAVVMLAPHLTPENADQILAAAANQSKAGIDLLLAERFPRPDLTARIEAIPPVLPVTEQVPGAIEQPAPGRVEAAVPPPKVVPLAAERYALQVTIDQRTHDQLRYTQELLSHQIPSGNLAQVLGRVLRVAIRQLEKRKFAGSVERRRASRRPTRSARHVPAHVKRAVWLRDGGQCTFVSENGHRCAACNFLEFDHVDPVARGGQATVTGMRLRCRAHNQYAAERTFGVEFMRHKRAEARNAAAAARARTVAVQQAEEVIPWLRALGFRADEARRAAARCEAIPDASLEQRVRLALTCFCPRTPAESHHAGLEARHSGPGERRAWIS